MTSAFLTPQHLRPFSRGAERMPFADGKFTNAETGGMPAPAPQQHSLQLEDGTLRASSTAPAFLGRQGGGTPVLAQIGRKLKPGQPGTKKLLREYGDNLVCVRYRYDAAQQRRLKTVELIIETSDWKPRPAKIPLEQIMHLRVNYGEVAVGQQVRAAGGKWNREKQAWELPYQEVLKLGLSARLIDVPVRGKRP